MHVRLFAAVLAIGCAPLAARAADEDFNPYKNTKVGDYATYKMTMKVPVLGNVSGTTTQKVTAKSEKEATVSMTVNIDFNGMKMDLPPSEQKVDLTKPYDPTKLSGLPEGADVKVEKGKEGKEKLKVGGKEYDCTWTTYTVKGKVNDQVLDAKVKSWTCKDAPLGMVKMEMSGEVAKMKMEMTMEMSESGNKKK